MSSPLKRAFNAARSSQKRVGGSQVTIARGLKTSAVVTATVGNSSSVSYDNEGSATYTKQRDYYVDVADYHFTGDANPSTPNRMDVITEVVDGSVLTFQVTAETSDEAYVFHGEQRTVYKVHTKEM